MKTLILTTIMDLFFSPCTLFSSDEGDFETCYADLFEEL